MRFVWGLFAAVLAALAAAFLRPDLVPGLSDLALQFPLAQVVAVRGWLAFGSLLAAAICCIFAVFRFVLLRRGRIALVLGLVFALVAGAHVVTIFQRGTSQPAQLAADRGVTPLGLGNGAITVMAYNIFGGKTTESELVPLIVKNGVDVVVLSEASVDRGKKLVAELAKEGIHMQEFDNDTSRYEPEFKSTILLISKALGTYTQVAAVDGVSSVAAAPVSGTGPLFIGVHPDAPGRENMDRWKRSLEKIYARCGELKGFVMLGDFNSTADHQRLIARNVPGTMSCVDAGAQANIAGLSTWPTSTNIYFGSTIDRVLTDGTSYVGTQGTVVEVGNSDHRGVIVRLTPGAQK